MALISAWPKGSSPPHLKHGENPWRSSSVDGDDIQALLKRKLWFLHTKDMVEAAAIINARADREGGERRM